MKANNITTLDELAQFINENEDYNVAAVESAIERNGWYVYDTEDDGFVCHDFTDKVELGENGAEVLPKSQSARILTTITLTSTQVWANVHILSCNSTSEKPYMNKHTSMMKTHNITLTTIIQH